MQAFSYNEGTLCCENVSLPSLAQELGTPLFVYSEQHIRQQHASYRKGIDAFLAKQKNRNLSVCYAVKANPNLALLRLFHGLGCGFDTVSQGEIERVLRAGGDPASIVFSGVGKSAAELEFAVDKGIGSICVESMAEFERLAQISGDLGKTANLSVRINPDVIAATHPSITTGGKTHKFGVSTELAAEILRQATQHPHIKPVGIGCHIGSQILSIEPFVEAAQKLREFYETLPQISSDLELAKISLGGGFGVAYQEKETPLDPAECRRLLEVFADLPIDLVLEPGRSLVAAAGGLLTKVEYLKESPSKNYAIVDAGMNDLPRPGLYDAYHELVPVAEGGAGNGKKAAVYDVAGPVCETTDVLARQRKLSIAAGDLLLFRDAGAYAMSMSSNYNSRPRAAEVLVSGREYKLIRRRETLEDMLSSEEQG